jgi:hypothetical protein
MFSYPARRRMFIHAQQHSSTTMAPPSTPSLDTIEEMPYLASESTALSETFSDQIEQPPSSPPTDPYTHPTAATSGSLSAPNSPLHCSSQKRHIEESNIDASQTDSSQKPKKSRRSPRSAEEKLYDVLHQIEESGWTMGKLLEQLLVYDSHSTTRSNYIQRSKTHFKAFAYKKAFRDNMVGFTKPEWTQFIWDAKLPTHVGTVVRKELEELGKHPSFGTFDYQWDPDNAELGTIRDMRNAERHILQDCPMLVEVLLSSSTSVHAKEKVVQEVENNPEFVDVESQRKAIRSQLMDHKLFAVAAILGSRLHLKLFDGVQTMLGLYMYQGGARKRVIETFSKFGLTKGFRTITDRYKKLNVIAQAKVREMGRNAGAVVVYDNFDFAVDKRDEVIGNKRSFNSITTTLVLEGIEMPKGGLVQSMWHPERPLLLRTILSNQSKDEVFYQVSMYAAYLHDILMALRLACTLCIRQFSRTSATPNSSYLYQILWSRSSTGSNLREHSGK